MGHPRGIFTRKYCKARNNDSNIMTLTLLFIVKASVLLGYGSARINTFFFIIQNFYSKYALLHTLQLLDAQ